MLGMRGPGILTVTMLISALALIACGDGESGDDQSAGRERITEATPPAAGPAAGSDLESGRASAEPPAGGRAAAVAAARRAVGGSLLIEVDRDDSGWEVKLRRNGRQLEVKLNRALRVLKVEHEDRDGDD
jgi:hypothetical protein